MSTSIFQFEQKLKHCFHHFYSKKIIFYFLNRIKDGRKQTKSNLHLNEKKTFHQFSSTTVKDTKHLTGITSSFLVAFIFFSPKNRRCFSFLYFQILQFFSFWFENENSTLRHTQSLICLIGLHFPLCIWMGLRGKKFFRHIFVSK